MKVKIMSLLILASLCMILTGIVTDSAFIPGTDVAQAAGEWTGSGNADDPYVIKTATQLVKIHDIVMSDNI